MHQFLRKALLTLTLLLILAGVAAGLLVYGVQSAITGDNRHITANHFVLEARKNLFEQVALSVAQLQPLAWNGQLIDALDSESPLNALQIARDFIRSISYEAQYIAVFDFDHELLMSSQQSLGRLGDDLSQYLKENPKRNTNALLFQAGEQIYQMIFLEIGGQTRPAGIIALGSLWNAEAALSSRIEDSGDWRQSVVVPESDSEAIIANEKNSLSWNFEIKGSQLQVDIPLINQRLPLQVRISNFHPSKDLMNLSLLLLPLGSIFILGFLGYVLIFYLYQQTFLPLDRLFLFIKMLQDRNRYQKRPAFRSFPLFRRIANEILDYLKEIESEKRSWQQKHHELQRKIECAQDLAALNPTETQIWAKMTIEILREMLRVTESIKAKPGPWPMQDLDPLIHLTQTLYQYQVCFALHGLTKSTGKLQALLTRVGGLQKSVDLTTLENLENQIFEILGQLEQCDEIRATWQGKSDPLDQQDGATVFDREWPGRFEKIASDFLRAKDSTTVMAKVAQELGALAMDINSVPWELCEKRIRDYCAEYGQLVGKYPPAISFKLGFSSLPREQILVIYPFLIEALGFLIEFSIEARRDRVQLGKSEFGQLLVELSQTADGYQVLCSDDGQHLPIKEALAALIPSGGFQLDEIDEAECWTLFNKIHLEEFVRGSGVSPSRLRSLIQLMERSRNMSGGVVAQGRESGGLQIAIKFAAKDENLLPNKIRSVETA